MRIGVDISQTAHQGSGVNRFTRLLVNSLLKLDKQNQYTFFFSSMRQSLDKEIEKNINSSGHRLIKWKMPPTFLSFIWNDLHPLSYFTTPYALRPTHLDWFISSDWIEPPLNVKKATVVHDLVYLKYPETLHKKIIETQKKRMNWVKKETKIIFADSQATKKDLIDLLNIPKEKIIVNYPGVDVTAPKKNEIEKTLKKFNLTQPFILSVGKLEPRKNIARLINAFKRVNNKNIELVIVGPKGWEIDKDNSRIRKFVNNDNIKYMGFINDNDLYSLYSSCLFFIYPSLYEGFGYPIIEAMKLGAPVTCSNTSSMKEIAENSALLFNPLKTDEMYQCINTLIQNEKLRKELIIKGKEEAAKYSWKLYIDKMIKALTSNN